MKASGCFRQLAMIIVCWGGVRCFSEEELDKRVVLCGRELSRALVYFCDRRFMEAGGRNRREVGQSRGIADDCCVEGGCMIRELLEYCEPLPDDYDDNQQEDVQSNVNCDREVLGNITDARVLEVIQKEPGARKAFIQFRTTGKLYRKGMKAIVDVIGNQLLQRPFEWKECYYEKIAEIIVRILEGEMKRAGFPLGEEPGRESKQHSTKLHYRLTKEELDVDGIRHMLEHRLMGSKAPNHPESPSLGERHWRQTFEYRRKWIAGERFPGVQDIFNTWPVLRTPAGPELIAQDFMKLRLVRGERIQHWPEFFSHLKESLSYSARGRRERELEEIIHQKNITDDGRILTELLLLCHILRPTPTSLSVLPLGRAAHYPGALERKGRGTRSTKSSILVRVSRENHVDAAIRMRCSSNPRPYILAVGLHRVANVTQLFVVIGDVKYAVKSAYEAIDICFKSFHVFNIEYPAVSQHVWMMIQLGLYQFQDHDSPGKSPRDSVQLLELDKSSPST